MQRKEYQFLLEAETPVAHHSETLGNAALLMERKVCRRDGTFVKVPVVTADTMRHGIREAAAYALLDAAGLLSATGEPAGLTEAALRLLFSGGMVTGRGDASAVSLEAYRKMAELIPSMALLGGCADNRVIPGRLEVQDAVLVCTEQFEHLPDWVGERLEADGRLVSNKRAHVEQVQRVRMDPLLDPGKRKLLTADAAASASDRLAASELAHAEDDAVAREGSKSSMMPRRFEVLVQGSLFYWAVGATCYSELDVDTFHVAVGTFLANCRVGGKKGTGHGCLRVVTAREKAWSRPAESVAEVDALGLGMGKLFRQHVAERAEEIKAWLNQANA